MGKKDDASPLPSLSPLAALRRDISSPRMAPRHELDDAPNVAVVLVNDGSSGCSDSIGISY
jgi:hypothetical protein